MLPEIGIDLMKRSLAMIDAQWPDAAQACMEVPLEYYRSEEQFRRDRALFERSPLAVLASSEIRNPFDYHVRIAMGRSLLLTRDEEGAAHVFLNYCRHRGAEPADGCGNARGFNCPYHAWRYDIRGRLITMPLRDRYAGMDLSRYGLVELPSQERHGLIWTVLTPGAPIDVAGHLGPIDAELAAYGFDRMTYHNSLVRERLGANWKAVTEGLVEALHVPYVHKATFNLNPQAVSLDLALNDAIGPHVRYCLPFFTRADVPRIAGRPEREWVPEDHLGLVWWISPGNLIARDLYGYIFADLMPGSRPDESFMRYGWMTPVPTAPEGMLSPEDMAVRAARAVREDVPVWEGCGHGLTLGGHDAAFIGRNEKAVQLVHESLARQTGYSGLRYC
ncbi:MAG: aromatic ring-hydroxylating dioxygenase subunit alpha [Gammaproteobacteria bacterium]